jgi:hypothetical protein
MWGMILIALIAIIVYTVLISNVKVRLKYIRSEADDEAVLTVIALYGLVYLHYRVPTVKLKGMFHGVHFRVEKPETGGETALEEMLSRKEMMRYYKHFKVLVRYMANYREWLSDTLSHFCVSKVRWRTKIGAGDAPETAVATGIAWSVKSSVLAQFLRFFRLDARPEIAVDPDFNHMSFRTEAELHMHVRAYRLLVSVVMLLLRILREKGGLKTWVRILFPRQAAR